MTPAEFKTLREALGLPAQWIATEVITAQRTVRRWEDGEIPVRADVAALLTRLEDEMTAEVAAIMDRIRTELDAAEDHDLAAVLDQFDPKDWPTLEVPRVDAHVPRGDDRPASYHRAVAAQVRAQLGGRLRLLYNAPPTTP